MFDGLQSLFSLDLSHNRISFIGLQVFSNSSDLTSLRSLDMHNNAMGSLEPWWYYRCILGNATSPVWISLNHNYIMDFTNKMQFAYRCGMKRPYGFLDLGRNQISHIKDIFTGWNVVNGSNFTPILCLTSFGAAQNMHFNFTKTRRYICDCTDFWFLKFAQNGLIWDMDNVYCRKPFKPFAPFQLASRIRLESLKCDITDLCPSGCRCAYYPGHPSVHVNCSTAANLSSLPLVLPPLPKSYVHYRLDFSKNKLIKRLDHRPYFNNTKYLDVNTCGISEIGPKVLKDMERGLLRRVNLQANMLQTFPRQADSMNISTTLYLGINPWRCSCEDSWMIGWLQSLSEKLRDPAYVTCVKPFRMYGRNILKSTVEDFCADPQQPAKPIWTTALFLSTVSSVAFVVVLLIITGLLVYKLRVKFFRTWKLHPFDRDECVGEDMDYDVFLCCSSEDHSHGLRILREMESNGYRVCYHLRDFLAGAPITDNMIQSIESSKRTVCLVSKDFLRRLCITMFQYVSITLFTNSCTSY